MRALRLSRNLPGFPDHPLTLGTRASLSVHTGRVKRHLVPPSWRSEALRAPSATLPAATTDLKVQRWRLFHPRHIGVFQGG